MRKAVICFLACLLVWSAASARVLDVTQAQIARLGIRTAPVRPAETQSTVSVLGRVMPAPDSRIPVSAPFAGAVERLLKLEGARVKVLMSRLEGGKGAPGEVLDDALLVACGEGAVRLLQVQREGRPAMAAGDFLRGNPVTAGRRLG